MPITKGEIPIEKIRPCRLEKKFFFTKTNFKSPLYPPDGNWKKSRRLILVLYCIRSTVNLYGIFLFF